MAARLILFSESKPRLGKVTVIRDPISGLRQVVPELFKEREPRLGNESHLGNWSLDVAEIFISSILDPGSGASLLLEL